MFILIRYIIKDNIQASIGLLEKEKEIVYNILLNPIEKDLLIVVDVLEIPEGDIRAAHEIDPVVGCLFVPGVLGHHPGIDPDIGAFFGYAVGEGFIFLTREFRFPGVNDAEL